MSLKPFKTVTVKIIYLLSDLLPLRLMHKNYFVKVREKL